MPNVTLCPPAPAYRLDKPNHGSHPIRCALTAEGFVSPTGLSFDDMSRMTTSGRSQLKGKRIIPDFVFNDLKLREVVVRCVELRAGMCKRSPAGTLQERLVRAEAALQHRRPAQIRIYDNLCLRYLEAQQARDPRAEKLLQEVENADTQLRTNETIAGVIASILFLSYRVNLTSVEVAAEVHLKPPMVRQILHRCRRIAAALEAGNALATSGTVRKRRPRRKKSVTKLLEFALASGPDVAATERVSASQ
jgi:hypothetical protein